MLAMHDINTSSIHHHLSVPDIHGRRQWRNYYGLRPGEPGGPQPQWAKWGPPGLGDRAKTLARASDMLSFSDHQNSVKTLPKVQEMAFQRV
jgi:hypothetical protein